MEKGLLSQHEIDALMALFDAPVQGADRHTAPEVRDVAALKSDLERKAERWQEMMETEVSQPVGIRLQSIVRTSALHVAEDEVLYRAGDSPACYLICPASLINYLNEKMLGSLEQIPLLMHTPTAIDKALFEQTGRMFSEQDTLTCAEKTPDAAMRLEARFSIEAAPFLRCMVRWIADEPV